MRVFADFYRLFRSAFNEIKNKGGGLLHFVYNMELKHFEIPLLA